MLRTKRKSTNTKSKKPAASRSKTKTVKRKKISSTREKLDAATPLSTKPVKKSATKRKTEVKRTPNIDPSSRKRVASGRAPGHRKIRLEKNFDNPTGSKVKIQGSALDNMSAEERVKRSVGVKINSK